MNGSPSTGTHHALYVDRHGGPDSLQWRSVATASPGEQEVLIRQHAIGVNYIDVYHRTGFYPLPLPMIPGVEGAGEVLEVGAGVQDFKAGDRVAYGGVIGGYQEVRSIGADRLVHIPDAVSYEVAAAMMLQGMTAQVLLRQVYEVKPGDTILVHAAAGGTGSLICQWAASLGATVIGTVSNREKAQRAKNAGCAHVVIHGEGDFVKRVAEITGNRKLPVVYDSIGRDTFLRSLDCLAPRGLMVSFGQASGPVAPLDPTLLAQKGSLYLTRPTVFTFIKDRSQLLAVFGELLQKVISGELRIQIHHRFALREASQAHIALEGRETTGPVILNP